MALANQREEPFGSFSAGKTILLPEMQCGKKKLHLTAPTHSFWADSTYPQFQGVAREIYKIVTFP